MLASKEIDTRPLFIAGESCESRNVRSPSPPVRRSISTDRASLVRRKTKIEHLDERTPLKLQFVEKTPVNKSRAATDDTSSKCWDPQEIGNLRRVNPEEEDKQPFKTAVYLRDAEVKAKNKASVRNEELTGSAEKSDSSEAENDCTLLESVHCSSQKLKKPQYCATRISPNVKQKYGYLCIMLFIF